MNAAAAAPLVAHVIYRLDYGGLENGLVNLINRLPRDKYRHAVVCLAGYSDFRNRIERSDVLVESLDKRPGKDLGAYGRAWRLLRRLKPAIVHTRNLGTVDMQWVAAAAGVRRRVHGEHGWEADDPRGLRPRSLQIRRACRPAIHRWVPMSADLAAWLTASVGVDPARIRQLYNGVDVAKFAPEGALPGDLPWASEGPSRPFVVATAGRLDPVKNQRELLRAFATLVARQVAGGSPRECCRLVVVGGGPLGDALRAEAVTLGIADLTWFTGARGDLPAILRAADVFVLPSLNEGISNTILEAMASGRPVIATRVGGNPELVVEGTTGSLYASGDESALAEALAAYCDDPGRRAAEAAAARRRAVDDFALERMVAAYDRLYGELLAG